MSTPELPATPPEGLAVIDKPAGWTSHDVVAKLRGILGTRKVGHSGTLDPAATGVLVIGVGRCTRLLTFLGGLPKSYEAVIQLGVETDSLDADGEVTVVHDMAPPTVEEVESVAAGLTGVIDQVPPMVSAVKVGGRRLHELAREGKEVAREPRRVEVSSFSVEATEDPMRWKAVVDCSAGTYVRVLASDLGRGLGGGAHLCHLRRTSVGPFTLEEAKPLEAVEVLAPSEIARVLPAVVVPSELAAQVRHGKVFERAQLLDPTGVAGDGGAEGPWAVLDDSGDLLAVYATHGKTSVKPSFVLAI
jgi:tRNA pseudouridine55 synthase